MRFLSILVVALLSLQGFSQSDIATLRTKLNAAQSDRERVQVYWQMAKSFGEAKSDSSLAYFRKARFLAGIIGDKATVAEVTSDIAGMLLNDEHPYAAQVLLSQVNQDDLKGEALGKLYLQKAKVAAMLGESVADIYSAALLNLPGNTSFEMVDEVLVQSWLSDQDSVARAALAERMVQYMNLPEGKTHPHTRRWMSTALLHYAQLTDSARTQVHAFLAADKASNETAHVADWYLQLMRLDRSVIKGDSITRHCDSLLKWMPSASRMSMGDQAALAALQAGNVKLALRITDSLMVWSQSPFDQLRTAQRRLQIFRKLGDTKNELIVIKQLYDLRDRLVKEEFSELNKQWLNDAVNVERQVQHLQKDNERNLSNYKVLLYVAAGLALLLVIAAIVILVRHAARRAKWATEVEALKERIANGEQVHVLEEEKLQRKEAEIKRKESESTKLRALVEQQEIELRRVGQEVGERLGQHLQNARTQLDAVRQSGNTVSVEQFMQLQNAITKANKEIKALTDTLVPDSLEQKGLLEALRLLAEKKQSPSIKIMIESQGKPFMLDHVQEVALYRICAEIIENALEHSDASSVVIRLNYLDRELVLVANDNGLGFDVNQSIPKGSGIKGIIARVTFLKGTLDIASKTGEGTEYTIGIKVNS